MSSHAFEGERSSQHPGDDGSDSGTAEKRMKRQPRQRSEEEQNLLKQAKSILMERNGMTEEEAHRYMQKCSMDSGTNMVETAQMVISLNNL